MGNLCTHYLNLSIDYSYLLLQWFNRTSGCRVKLKHSILRSMPAQALPQNIFLTTMVDVSMSYPTGEPVVGYYPGPLHTPHGKHNGQQYRTSYSASPYQKVGVIFLILPCE